MFDTHQAVKELNFPTLSLAYLLKTYCNIDASKQFQLADWRLRFVRFGINLMIICFFLLRPLPNGYLRYAQEDTHYLLYIYDRLRNQLLEKSEALRSVYTKSKIICQKVKRNVSR